MENKLKQIEQALEAADYICWNMKRAIYDTEDGVEHIEKIEKAYKIIKDINTQKSDMHTELLNALEIADKTLARCDQDMVGATRLKIRSVIKKAKGE